MQLPKRDRTTPYNKGKETISVDLKREHDFSEKYRSRMKWPGVYSCLGTLSRD
jgi:hypothetical protein